MLGGELEGKRGKRIKECHIQRQPRWTRTIITENEQELQKVQKGGICQPVVVYRGPVAQKLKIKRKSQKSNASQKNQT